MYVNMALRSSIIYAIYPSELQKLEPMPADFGQQAGPKLLMVITYV